MLNVWFVMGKADMTVIGMNIVQYVMAAAFMGKRMYQTQDILHAVAVMGQAAIVHGVMNAMDEGEL